MTTDEAKELIRAGILEGDAPVGHFWADFGAGSGTFTFALAELLGPEGTVVAVDREDAALDSLRRRLDRDRTGAGIVVTEADFREPGAIETLRDRKLNGALFANALHFDPDPVRTVGGVLERLAPGGRIVVVEYQDRPPNPWVPHPLPVARLEEVAGELGLAAPSVVGERPSSYGGFLYCAWVG